MCVYKVNNGTSISASKLWAFVLVFQQESLTLALKSVPTSHDDVCITEIHSMMNVYPQSSYHTIPATAQ